MRKATSCALLLMWASLAAEAQTLQRGSKLVKPPVTQELGLSEYHALVIGINDYTSLPPLKTAIGDAEAVGQLLADQYGFEVRLAVNATRAVIMAELAELRRTLTKDSSLLIYYAGHGELDERTDKGYWLPVDAHKDHKANWITTGDITSELNAIDASHVMIVADSCYSGTFTRDAGTELDRKVRDEEWLRRMASRKSRHALTSGGNEPVNDGGGSGHSVFAKAFMDTLRENRSILDGRSLFDDLKIYVANNARQTPRYAGIKYSGHDEGDFIFVPRTVRGSLTLAEATLGSDLFSRESTSISSLTPAPLASGPQLPAWGEIEALNQPVRLAGGEFQMGQASGLANEEPVHLVRLSPFYMQQREVTNAEYQLFDSRHRFMPGTEDKPVLGLTWDEARTYAQWLGGDLPTEAQWEFAARGSEGRTYPWGEEAPSCEHANFAQCGMPVDVRPATGRDKGATPEGILDLAGNAPEWVRDWFGGYHRKGADDPTGPESGSQKVLRGGSFGLGPEPLRSAARYSMEPDIPGNGNGFRVVWSEPQYVAASGEETPDTVASMD